MGDETPLVAYSGARGSYAELAASTYFGAGVELHQCDAGEEVFQKVSSGDVPLGLVPVENSYVGALYATYDALVMYKVNIVGEVEVPIDHHLLTLPGVSLQEITEVYSHPLALQLCEGTLHEMLPDAEWKTTRGTSWAAKHLIDEDLHNAAAVAGAPAADAYGLAILAKGIVDHRENSYARYLIISHGPEPVGGEGPQKTSLVMVPNKGPQALFKCLATLALRDIQIEKVESRPRQPTGHLYYVQVLANQEDPEFKNAMNHLSELTEYQRVLGTYSHVDGRGVSEP